MIISIPDKIEDITEEYLKNLESLKEIEEATYYDFTLKTEHEDLRKKLCAFSNMDGGYYFIGIRHKDGILTIEGTDDKVSTDWIYEAAKIIEPKISILADKRTIEGKNVFIIKIKP